jgi:hypothetical protein
MQRLPVRIPAMTMDDVKENSLFDLIFNQFPHIILMVLVSNSLSIDFPAKWICDNAIPNSR